MLRAARGASSFRDPRPAYEPAGRQVLLQVGGVAAGALVIPGLVAPGPMQTVAGFELLIGQAWNQRWLAPLPFQPAVPGDA